MKQEYFLNLELNAANKIIESATKLKDNLMISFWSNKRTEIENELEKIRGTNK